MTAQIVEWIRIEEMPEGGTADVTKDFNRLCDIVYEAANSQGIFSVDDLRPEDVVQAVLAELLKIAEAQPATTEYGMPTLGFLREMADGEGPR